MSDKPAERALYELEHFGVPTRDSSLEEAERLVSQGGFISLNHDVQLTKIR